MDEYRYKRLDHDRPTFRLLRLHQGSRDELTCNLFEALLHHDDLIQYEALSYTWGASVTPKSVTMDEQKLAITENLYQALISLRRPYTDRILWIDAMCIDQSNKRERSHQVAQMSDIYKQADCVVFFLGRETYSTDVFMDYMSLFQKERSNYAYRSWARDDKRWEIIQEALQGETNKPDIEILSIGLKSLLNSSWFLRVWILQEVANAKNAIVCCGRKEIAASVFSIAPIIFSVSPSAHCQSAIDIMPGPWRKTSWWSKGPCLYTLLSKFGRAQATESQDLIYALRGLATDKESHILTPDYDKSEECLVRDVIQFLFDFEYDAKMAWSVPRTIRDVIKGLERIKDLIFMERIRAGEMSRLTSLLQAPGFTFSPTVVEAAIQYDQTGQIIKMLMKHDRGCNISKETLLIAAEKGSVLVFQSLEYNLGNGVAAASKEMLLAAANNHRHGGDIISYILERDQELDDYSLVAEAAASNSKQASRIVQQLLGRGSRITMTPQLHTNAFYCGCYKELLPLFIKCPPVGPEMRDKVADVDANFSADDPAENARTVFKSIARFLVSYAAYDDIIFDIFRQSSRQIAGYGYNVLEELALCATEVFNEGWRSLLTPLEEFERRFGTLNWVAEESGLDLCITIGAVEASIEGGFTRGMSRLLMLKQDSADINADAAAEIIRSYRLSEDEDILTTEAILLYHGGQYRQTQMILEALKQKYCGSEGRPDGRWLHVALGNDCSETLRWLLSCGADPNEKSRDGDTLLTRTGDLRTAAIILSYGADPNIRRERKHWRSSLCLAVGERKHDLLELLLASGANPNIVDGSYGNTPLTRAAHSDDIGLVELLLRYGADTAARNDVGESAEDLAKSDAIIALLRKHSSWSFSCSASGINSGNWTLYHDAVKLYSCKEPMLLDMSLHTPVDDPSKTLSLFACWGNNKNGDASCNEPTANANVTTTSDTSETATVEVIWSGTGQSQRAGDAVAVAQYASSQTSPLSCELDDRTSTFAHLNGVFIGVWTGPMVDKQTTVNLLDQVVSGLKNKVQGSLQLSQVCGSNRTSDYTVGVAVAIPESVADLTALAQVQNAVKTWSMGDCVAADSGSSKTSKSTLEVHQLALTSPNTRRDLDTRANCRTIVVIPGDSCGSLAKKCGISGTNFTKYNPKKNLCSTLAVKQHVCCSSGTLPNYAPKPQSDGVCATYLVKKGDTCADLAAFYTVTITQIENWNKKTWGWMGCKDLQAKMKICLSSGDALMPAPIANAKCGPQVPGTKRPTNGTALALLNQCPLKACCDKWGQCGITAQFCTQIDSATGAPGTSKNGTNGCISNCGTKIISSSAPAHFRSVAYFEAFNSGRKCLNMDVRSLQGFNYDTIHFAFANITKGFDVDVSSLKASFQDFVTMKNNGFQRVLSFGGWSFSTDVDFYPIFRESVTDANRATFASNLAAFVKKWNLDGVDFDWEYPGAPDIPGIPPGNPGDGGRYLSFLKTLKSELPSGTTLSIAAPASYWYLKGFPIADISKVFDYIIYMTYDFHGQWDWNNTWSDRPGCTHGGCLRSHVNLTETMEALTMITKANGNKNGFKPRYNDPSIMAGYISGDITSPGGVAIPVCSAQEAFDNWYVESTTKKNFPCN
ncbi:hypothetical protein MKX08_004568 [Trichoderma sp. CBMAI-0020]|nr:hypothetical protein MKX08_004568 [Trichoderma sp. CBMAI-0020]